MAVSSLNYRSLFCSITIHTIMLYNFISYIHQTLHLLNPLFRVVSKAFEIIRTQVGMARPFAFSSRITGIIHNVFESFLDRNGHTLGESRHAPPPEDRDTSSANSVTTPPISHTPSHISSSSPYSTPLSSQNSTPLHNSTVERRSVRRMHPVANVDDTAGFMAAARALKLDPNAYRKASSVAAEDASSEYGSLSHENDPAPTGDFVLTSTPKEATAPSEFQMKDHNEFAGSDNDNMSSDFAEEPKVAEEPNTPEFASINNSPTASRVSIEGEQDREHLTTFQTWGAPEVRDKPTACVRRIIIRGLPSTWCTSAKVLSLIHGGPVESVSVTPSGTAHILFCEHEACKAFYDKYPNGIDLDKERKVTVFVEMGKEVDVVSSQLSFSLSTGATRAIRAVGIGLNVTMRELSDMATGSHRKVEKILDTYVPGDARNVIFRFCSIADAIRFRAMLVRDERWEQCNIQYAADPCELATGYHVD